MKKILLLSGLLLALTATVASAAGNNLAWNNCLGGGGVSDRTFACNTNGGDNIFVASVIAPAGIGLWTSFETYMIVQSNSPVLPAWWQLRNETNQLNQCRNGALTVSADFTGAPYFGACLDSYAGGGSGGISNYRITPVGGNRVDFKVTLAVPSAGQVPLDANGEYFTMRARITNIKTVGTGLCAGCEDGVCINVTLIRVLQPSGAPGGNVNVTAPAVQSHVTWNNPTAEACQGATPAKSTTWGSVKALYR